MRLAVLNDPQGAGRRVLSAAIARGHTAARNVEDADAVYVRTCTFGEWRGRGLKMIAEAHAAGKVSLPTYEQSMLYDDKAAQIPVLQRWLPPTRFITNPAEAWATIDGMRYPFVSKAAVGASSRNVRLVKNRDQAAGEINGAWGPGIPLDKGTAKNPKATQEQRGYLIWQDYIPGNPGDVRVVINGDFAYGLRRYNRPDPDHPFASGSGKRDVIRALGDPDTEALRAFIKADEISKSRGFRWACYDFVFDGGKTLVLEVSFSWVENAYDDCPLFPRGSSLPTNRRAAEWATLAVMELERMAAG